MLTLTPKENYMRIIHGELPESVPYQGQAPAGEVPYTMLAEPSCLGGYRGPNGGVDPFGVKYVTNEETGWAALPEPGHFILDDIRKWRDVIKRPDLSGIDWEMMAKKDIEALGIDRNKTALVVSSDMGYFQPLMGMMGFENGLCALFEEPDEVLELFEMMSGFYEELAKNVIYYYKPDLWAFGDDTATQKDPFISPEMFKKMIVPYYKRCTDISHDAGVPVDYHNCGHCEALLDEMVYTLGISSWNPAQTSNDILAIKQKYKGKLAVVGGYDFKMGSNYESISEEYVRNSVRETIDKYAPGGGYAFCGGIAASPNNKIIARINSWISDEVVKYGTGYYLK